MAEASAENDVAAAQSRNENVSKDGGYAVVMIGATGATGKYLFAELIQDKRFSKITAIGRRPASIPDDFEGSAAINLEEEVKSGRLEQINDIDPNGEINETNVGKYFEGKDAYFSCFGTSRKQAGSADEFRRIDYGINNNFMEVANKHKVPFCALVSSFGAHSKSFFLYFQVKGQLEDNATNLFEKASIFRPGILDRGTSQRFTERVTGWIMTKMKVQILARAIHLDAVDRMSKKNGEEGMGTRFYGNSDIYSMCGSNNKGVPNTK